VPGNRVIRHVLKTVVTGAEAESERRLHRLLHAARITGWAANHVVRVAGRAILRIDIAFVAERIAIEVDGFAYHSDRDRYQRDRSRQNQLVTSGWTVLRFTWEDITSRPEHVISVILSALDRAA
jgi:very-short-patch-repair endonuclease